MIIMGLPVVKIVTATFQILGAAWKGWREGVKAKVEEKAMGWSHRQTEKMRRDIESATTRYRVPPKASPISDTQPIPVIHAETVQRPITLENLNTPINPIIYPLHWPRCPICNDYCLEGIAHCGKTECTIKLRAKPPPIKRFPRG